MVHNIGIQENLLLFMSGNWEVKKKKITSDLKAKTCKSENGTPEILIINGYEELWSAGRQLSAVLGEYI